MEIIVEGKAISYLKPDQVIINFDFIMKGNSYEEVLELGVKNVEDFIQNLILKNSFAKEDLKTRSFTIREDRKYNEATRRYDFDGYVYSQGAMLKFDYNASLLAHIFEELSKLATPPKAYVNFGIKNERECRKNMLGLAYKDAKEQAEMIALAAGKTLQDCLKVDFKPIITSYISRSSFNGDMLYEKRAVGRGSTSEVITNIFTPEDIELTENLYCVWVAE